VFFKIQKPSAMKKSTHAIHWMPRILCILAIIFVSMFALDAFEPGLAIWKQLSAFVIHLIPSFILLALLIVAWKWEYAGGIIFILIGIGFSPFIYSHNYAMNHSVWISLSIILMITFPFVVVGILFVISHFRKKKDMATN
jgi:hypothetical protein